jgi:hypothetical protein
VAPKKKELDSRLQDRSERRCRLPTSTLPSPASPKITATIDTRR